MRCTSPRTVGFHSDGKTLCWSQRKSSKEYPSFQLPCGKCIACRLENSRQWAVRCIHEAQMHENNSFITLTYSDENLLSDKLNYIDFQLFAKRLRDHIFREYVQNKFGEEFYKNLSKKEKKQFRESHKNELEKTQISIFVTGEYGDKTKRPHWHALIFNWRPTDCKLFRTNEHGDNIYTSRTLDKLWGKNDPQKRPNEIGDITFESAGYVARYAAKKLIHGKDNEHDYHPISKKSSKNAIGKKFLEKNWQDIFNLGHIVLPNGKTCSIPRYYEKKLKDINPEKWKQYVTQLKEKNIQKAQLINKKEEERHITINKNQYSITRNQARAKILAQKFKQLQKFLKM